MIVNNDNDNVDFWFYEELNEIVYCTEGEEVKYIGCSENKNILISTNEHNKNDHDNDFEHGEDSQTLDLVGWGYWLPGRVLEGILGTAPV